MGRTLLPTASRHWAAEQNSEQNSEESAAGRGCGSGGQEQSRGAGRWKERPNNPINKPEQRRLLRSKITIGPAARDGRIYGTVSQEEGEERGRRRERRREEEKVGVWRVNGLS